MSIHLSPHFDLSEFTDSDTAERLGIDNSSPATLLGVISNTADGMEKVRALLGSPINIHSGYRCEALERVLCAKDFASWRQRHGYQLSLASWTIYFGSKAHPQGYAVDFTCAGFGDPLEIVKAIQASDIEFDQLIQEGKWVHISFAPAMRGQVMAATFNCGTPTYTQGV